MRSPGGPSIRGILFEGNQPRPVRPADWTAARPICVSIQAAVAHVAVAHPALAALHGVMPSFPTELRNHLGERLDFFLHQAASIDAPMVVMGHGVTGHKDRPLLIAVAEELAANGCHALRFSFAGNGSSEGRFEESTIAKEVQELRAVIDAVERPVLGYVGHSMGGAVGCLYTSDDPRIKFLISLAGIAHTADFAERQFGSLRPGELMWGKPNCPLSDAYVQEMKRVANVLPSARRIHVPWLLVHGTADDLVPVQDSRDVLAVGQRPTAMEVVGADHTFSANQPAVARSVARWVLEQTSAIC
jgi:alpha/beta superfamily hydrolase